jgi:hypothetical protein
MTEAKIVAAIKNYVTSQRGVTGFSLRNEQVADEVDTLRMRMILEADSARLFRKPFQGYTQKISFTVPGNKKVDLPKVYIRADGTPAVAYVGGQLGNTAYRLVTGYNHGQWVATDEFSLLPVAMLEGTEFTFKNFASNSLIMIAVFEDPSSLEAYGYDPGYDTEDGEEGDDYPMPNAMIDQIIGKTAESYIRTMFRIPPQPNTQIDAPPTGK